MELELISRKPKRGSHAAPILFVHGAWHGAWCWDKYFLPYFAEQGYNAYALSLRGHGKSECPGHFRWMRIADYAADVAQIAGRLPKLPVIVGHSMGGMVVQKYLEKHTAPAAVLMASVPVSGVLRTTLRIARHHPLAFLKVNLTGRLYPIIGTHERTRELFFSEDIPEETLNEYFRQLGDEAYGAFMDMLMLNLPKPEKISTDLLILGAEKDTIFYPGEVEATAAAYGKTAEMFKAMAHDMMLEPGWQQVADRIMEWLAEKGLGAVSPEAEM